MTILSMLLQYDCAARQPRTAAAAMFVLWIAIASVARGASPPEILRAAPANEGDVVALADGRLKCYFMLLGEQVASVESTDRGRTWSEPVREFPVADDTGHAVRLLVDRQQTLHLFYVQRRDGGDGLPGGRYLDVWHVRQKEGQPWEPARRIWEGYCGALRGAAEMPNGRLLLPFAAWRQNADKNSSTGSNDTMMLYSDDGGQQWKLSPARLTAPVNAGYNGANYGAVEPSIAVLSDGRVWMLIRTQTGFLYESFSRDGVTWSEAAPSRFASSNSPATLLQLKDGRLLVIWNHCEMPPRHDGAGVYGGRDALHAAISSDDGASWRGFREIYRDPTRDESPPKRGDRGTAYANAVEIDAGKVLVATGQGPARRMLIVDPDWLLETRHSDDFSAGLQAWSVFKSFGPAIRWWRDRTTGAGLVTHPDTPHRQVLHLGRAAGEEPDGAVWNFPAGQNVTVTLRTRLEPNFGGATIALVDRFFEPTDRRAVDLAIASCTITPNGQIGDGPVLSADGWHEIRLACRVKQRDARLLLDGALSHPLAINEPSPVGVSYLWISSDAQTSDTGGLLVERVSAEVEP